MKVSGVVVSITLWDLSCSSVVGKPGWSLHADSVSLISRSSWKIMLVSFTCRIPYARWMVSSGARVDFDAVETYCTEELVDPVNRSSSAPVRAQESKQMKVRERLQLIESRRRKMTKPGRRDCLAEVLRFLLCPQPASCTNVLRTPPHVYHPARLRSAFLILRV